MIEYQTLNVIDIRHHGSNTSHYTISRHQGSNTSHYHYRETYQTLKIRNDIDILLHQTFTTRNQTQGTMLDTFSLQILDKHIRRYTLNSMFTIDRRNLPLVIPFQKLQGFFFRLIYKHEKNKNNDNFHIANKSLKKYHFS